MIVEKRSRDGDWELDAVIGKHHQQALVTLVEPKSRLTLIAKVVRKTAENVHFKVLNHLTENNNVYNKKPAPYQVPASNIKAVLL